MKKFLVAVLSVLFLLIGQAGASTLTFDDIGGGGAKVPDGYGGLNYSPNFYYLDGTSLPGSGYDNGRKSGDFVAYNAYGGEISASNASFDLNSLYVTAAWREGMDLQIVGTYFAGGSVIADYVIGLQTPLFIDLNWMDISSVQLFSSGGVEVPGLNGSGTHFAIDNIVINEPVNPVPEPATMLLLGLGLISVVALRRR